MNGKRILIAEDDPSIRRMTALRLEHEGFDVISVADGEAVVRQAQGKLPIHLILLDIKMPKMDGYEVCRELKSRPATAGIPIIVFTASESQMRLLAERCIEVGARDWLRKPFRTKELMEKVERALTESKEG